MSFIKNATIAFAAGVGVGTLFYIVGGVAATIFPISPLAAGTLGFTSAVAIGLLEGEKKDLEKE